MPLPLFPYLFGYKMGVSPLKNDYKWEKSVLWNFAIIPVLPFLHTPKDLDLSYKMDLFFFFFFFFFGGGGGGGELCLIT